MMTPFIQNVRTLPNPRQARGLSGMLIDSNQIRDRIRGLAGEITRDYQGKNLVLVALLNGSFMFLADLIRDMPNRMEVDFLGVSSYKDATIPGGLEWTKPLSMNLEGKHVLVVDDILDTGQTLVEVLSMLQTRLPASLATCVFIEKERSRENLPRADYAAFRAPDFFVVGYGMDFAGKFRNLPFVGIMKND